MVIQRWQSVLLLCAVVCMACFSFMSLGQVQEAGFYYNFFALGFRLAEEPTAGQAPEFASTWYFFAVSLLSAILPLIAIFTFKNCKLQKNLCLLTMLMLACVICIGAVIAYGGPYNVEWGSLVCAPFIALIATIMAYQRIKADERLLRSADRLR
ncbi:MAG: DUF4293 domain-containing protein [Muribaculaceae bacterium]|nr:DUF4293 domain-containing protein [Muribaculaceae bacterium]